MKRPLSASRLNDYLGCAHQAALWLDGVKPSGETDPTLELIRNKGFEHEAQVLARLEQTLGPAVRIPGQGDLAARIQQTADAIKAGAPLIFQAAVTNEPWQGFPDFLVRKPGAIEQRFDPEDAKLARNAKGEYLLQLGLYAEMLETSFGITVGNGVVHVAAGAPQTFDLRQTRHILKRLMGQFERFAASSSRATRPMPCSACAQCDYQTRCEDEWRQADSPFFVAGLTGAQVAKLEQSGIRTLAALAALPPHSKVDGIGPDTLAKLAAQARLQLKARSEGKHSFEVLPPTRGRGFALLPPPTPHDIYFDMEGDPLLGEGLEYLFGLYGRLGDARDPEFRPFWAHNAAEEKAAFEQVMRLFVDHLAKHPGAHIYHYAQYESHALKLLAMRYATMEAELDQILRDRRFVDLYRVVVQAVRASTESYSLKDLEPVYGHARAGDVKTAAGSIVEYERWCVTGDPSILDSIRLYNKEDCVSTASLHAWLEKLRPPGAVYSIINELAEEKKEKSAERAVLQAHKLALAARVRASGHSDPRIRELVAELLWFHQRSQKPGWWAVFERQAWTDEELAEDPESLGGLVRDPKQPPVAVKQSTETAYTFLPQDTKLKAGDAPKIAETIGYAGSIVELSAEDGRVVLRRGNKSGAMPDRLSLVPAPIDMQHVPDAVLAFAERFASAQGDPALMDILARRAPRFRKRAAGGAIRRDGEGLLDASVNAAKDLDSSYLFIQGPPGTGKTYTAARTIIALLRAGARVGVSSNSHKAINKLLDEVQKRATEERFSFVGVKRGSKDDPETAFNGANITTVFKSEEVTATHRLVGGTVFHFSRDDQRQAYDYLFVDEAGQVALGNLVAMGGCARNIVLIGDQMQLPQPVQGVHPGESGLSSLEYLLEDRATVPPDHGILLNETRRLHPRLCDFISAAVYDDRLTAHPATAERYLVLGANAHDALKPAGLSFVGVPHSGCTQSSREEATVVSQVIASLLGQKVHRANGAVDALTHKDILVVAPYNLQVNLLKQVLPSTIPIGTVDKFQGQEAAVVIVSMTTSEGADAPRGTAFLFNRNRFNVAVSRAQSLAIVVHGQELLDGAWTRIDDLRRLNLFAHAEAAATSQRGPPG